MIDRSALARVDDTCMTTTFTSHLPARVTGNNGAIYPRNNELIFLRRRPRGKMSSAVAIVRQVFIRRETLIPAPHHHFRSHRAPFTHTPSRCLTSGPPVSSTAPPTWSRAASSAAPLRRAVRADEPHRLRDRCVKTPESMMTKQSARDLSRTARDPSRVARDPPPALVLTLSTRPTIPSQTTAPPGRASRTCRAATSRPRSSPRSAASALSRRSSRPSSAIPRRTASATASACAAATPARSAASRASSRPAASTPTSR